MDKATLKLKVVEFTVKIEFAYKQELCACLAEEGSQTVALASYGALLSQEQ